MNTFACLNDDYLFGVIKMLDMSVLVIREEQKRINRKYLLPSTLLSFKSSYIEHLHYVSYSQRINENFAENMICFFLLNSINSTHKILILR